MTVAGMPVERSIWVPCFDDYEGGPTQPAFTSEDLAREYIASQDDPREWSVMEWPLFDRQPVKVEYFRRYAHVHWDGVVCGEIESSLERWEFDRFEVPAVRSTSFGVVLNVWASSRDEADAEFARELASAVKAMAIAGDHDVWGCGRGCSHPAVRQQD